MTTALQIINRAAEIIGYKDPEEALSGTDASNFLAILNDMLGTWNTNRLFVPATTTVSASVSASPVSVGPSQTLDTVRPVRIEGAWVRVNGVDHHLTPRTAAQYDAIADKSTTGTLCDEFFYSPDVPYGALYLYPVPAAAVSLYVRVMSQLSEFADLGTDYDLGQGYKRALEYSLAEELTPGRRPLDPQVAQKAALARKAIKRANFEPVMVESLMVSSPLAFDIQTGQ